MHLKRIYKPDPALAAPPALDDAARQAIRRAAGQKQIPAAAAEKALGLVLAGVEVKRAPKDQTFSTKLVERGVAEGWITSGRGRITVHGAGGDIVYRIRRGPGHFCCHCGLAQGGQDEARAHLAAAHAGAPSPDPNNPSGYGRLNGYACEREG